MMMERSDFFFSKPTVFPQAKIVIMKLSFSWRVALVSLLWGASLSAQNQDGSEYVYPQVAFDEAAAKLQMEPGTASIRGTVSAKENKALIKSLNLSKSRFAYPGTVVTLMPETAYLEEWRNLQKRLQKKAMLQKAALAGNVYCYRVLTKVTDERGSFEFRDLKPGKYYLFSEVSFVKAGSYVEQTGSVDTVHVGSGQVLASTPTYTAHAYAVDVSKAATAIVTIASEGQVVEVKVSGQ